MRSSRESGSRAVFTHSSTAPDGPHIEPSSGAFVATTLHSLSRVRAPEPFVVTFPQCARGEPCSEWFKGHAPTSFRRALG
eukprot:4921632-Alexandrium_andersonii.AAC.1